MHSRQPTRTLLRLLPALTNDLMRSMSYRSQLADQQETFARKTDLETLVASLKEAVLKAEAQHEKRFEEV